METRRAVLADYGAATARRSCLVPVAPPELTEAIDQGPTPVTDVQVVDLDLLGLLAWARARGVLAREDAWMPWGWSWPPMTSRIPRWQGSVAVSRLYGLGSESRPLGD